MTAEFGGSVGRIASWEENGVDRQAAKTASRASKAAGRNRRAHKIKAQELVHRLPFLHQRALGQAAKGQMVPALRRLVQCTRPIQSSVNRSVEPLQAVLQMAKVAKTVMNRALHVALLARFLLHRQHTTTQLRRRSMTRLGCALPTAATASRCDTFVTCRHVCRSSSAAAAMV